MPISGDACSCSPGPRLEPETAVRQVIPEMVEIGDHLQELADDDGAPCWIIPQVARISIDQRLIDATKVEPPKPLTRECEEPACAVECLSDAGGWQLGAIAGKIRSEEHTSELQSLMRISYAVFCLKKKKQQKHNT